MKPLIGITTPVNDGKTAWTCMNISVRIAGGIPVKLTAHNNRLRNKLDGLILSGGTDINPTLYSRESGPKESLYDNARDQMECELASKMLTEKKPVLGVCRGAQMINVVLGGNLYQDVSSVYEDFIPVNSLLGKIFYRKRIFIAENTHLFKCILGKKIYRVNSLHHQAINKLGEGLTISASEENGLVQAIEYSDMNLNYILGVQWHPEYLIYKPGVRQLFYDFIRACKK